MAGVLEQAADGVGEIELAEAAQGLVVRLATTATANARVTDDVAAQLDAGSGGEPTLVLRGPLARKSLHLNVLDGLSPVQRYGWVAQSLPSLPVSGIVYVLTVADADRLEVYDVVRACADAGCIAIRGAAPFLRPRDAYVVPCSPWFM